MPDPWRDANDVALLVCARASRGSAARCGRGSSARGRPSNDWRLVRARSRQNAMLAAAASRPRRGRAPARGGPRDLLPSRRPGHLAHGRPRSGGARPIGLVAVAPPDVPRSHRPPSNTGQALQNFRPSRLPDRLVNGCSAVQGITFPPRCRLRTCASGIRRLKATRRTGWDGAS